MAPAAGRGRSCACCSRTSRCCRRPRPPKQGGLERRQPDPERRAARQRQGRARAGLLVRQRQALDLAAPAGRRQAGHAVDGHPRPAAARHGPDPGRRRQAPRRRSSTREVSDARRPSPRWSRSTPASTRTACASVLTRHARRRGRRGRRRASRRAGPRSASTRSDVVHRRLRARSPSRPCGSSARPRAGTPSARSSCCRGPSANGFVQHAFEAGADDLVDAAVARRRDERGRRQLGFAVEKAVARRTGAAAAGATALASLICVLGPKGGIGKTLTSANLAVALALDGPARRGRRPRPAVRRRRALARTRPAADDLRPRQVGRIARRREGRGLPDAARERRAGPDGAGAAGPGRRGDDRVPARALSAAASRATTSWSSTRRPASRRR